MRFGFIRTPEVEQKVSGVLRRAVALDNPPFLDRLQYMTGLRLSRKFVETARSDPAATYASGEPVGLRDVRRPVPVVKGTSVWISPGEVVTEEASLMPDDDSDNEAGEDEDPSIAGPMSKSKVGSRPGARSERKPRSQPPPRGGTTFEAQDAVSRGDKERVVDWAVHQFSDLHAEDPYNPDHLVHWGVALALKAHILASRAHRQRRRLPDHLRRIEIADDSDRNVLRVTDPSGHFELAGEVFEKALRLAPGDTRATAAWGTVLAQRAIFARDVGFYRHARLLAGEARAMFEQVLESRPRDNLMRANLGKILVVEATSFPDLDQHRPGTLFQTQRGKDLSDKYPRFARCLVVFKLLQSIDKIERGISVLQECLDREPDFVFAKECHRDACIIYASRFMSRHNHIN